MFSKIISFYKGQSGISMVGLLMALAITGVVAIGATVASMQLLRAPEGVRVQGGNVATQQGQSLAELKQAPYGRLQGLPAIWYAIIGLSGDVTLGGSTLVKSDPLTPAEGDIYANGNINLSNLNPGGGKGVLGDAEATGTITDPNSAVSGTKTSPPPQDAHNDFVQIGQSIYGKRATIISMAQDPNIGGGTITPKGGTYNVTSNETLGPLYINGNLRIGSNVQVTLAGPIFVTGWIRMEGTSNISGLNTIAADGTIDLRGNTRLDLPNMPFVASFSTGGITVSGNPASGMLYAPNGPITLQGGAIVYGTVIGQSVSNNGNVTVEYPVVLRREVP
ncbi:MAG: hypothetical protein HY670_04400 [Chloroflexi bacterium]|nr:hypothetical protein [Chloroflexota bacterium]